MYVSVKPSSQYDSTALHKTLEQKFVLFCCIASIKITKVFENFPHVQYCKLGFRCTYILCFIRFSPYYCVRVQEFQSENNDLVGDDDVSKVARDISNSVKDPKIQESEVCMYR